MSMANALADNLKHHMRSRGLSSRELARRADVKPSFIYDILKGKSRNPSGTRLAQIAESLGLEISHLLQETHHALQGAPHTSQIGSIALTLHDTQPKDAPSMQSLPQLNIYMQQEKRRVVARRSSDTPMQFSTDWLRHSLHSQPENLCCWHMQSDAMTPTLQPDDILIIDQSRTTPYPAGIFLLFDGYDLLPRRLEVSTLNNGAMLSVSADNQFYRQYHCPLSQTDILGRVIWAGRKII